MTKTMRASHTLEFKQEAVRLVEGGQSTAAVAHTLSVVDQTLFNKVAHQSHLGLRKSCTKTELDRFNG